MTKKPNADAIMSELGRESAFFREAVEGRRSEPKPTAVAEESQASEPSTLATPVPHVRDVRPVRRKKTRHPFDLYEDQVDKLRELAARDRMRGGIGSMSEMVRDAIDEYLAKQPVEERT